MRERCLNVAFGCILLAGLIVITMSTCGCSVEDQTIAGGTDTREFVSVAYCWGSEYGATIVVTDLTDKIVRGVLTGRGSRSCFDTVWVPVGNSVEETYSNTDPVSRTIRNYIAHVDTTINRN